MTIDVLANDRDAEDDPLTAAPTSLPANGTLTLNPSGSFTYTPNLNFVGEDSFTYEARDDSGLRSSEATVTITVVAPERHLETSPGGGSGRRHRGA